MGWGLGGSRDVGKGREEDQQTVDVGIYRSSSSRIDYVQYKPFIQIKL